jgi:hypothetical protein
VYIAATKKSYLLKTFNHRGHRETEGFTLAVKGVILSERRDWVFPRLLLARSRGESKDLLFGPFDL